MLNITKNQSLCIIHVTFMRYHPVQAKKSFCPKSFLSLTKSNMNVYINTVGSATPRMSRGCPPTTEWITPQSAVDARVCTAVKVPSVTYNQTKHVLANYNRILATQKRKIHQTCISLQLLPKRYNRNCWSKKYVCCWSQDPKPQKIKIIAPIWHKF